MSGPSLSKRLELLRNTAGWVREEFAGQTTDKQRAELVSEADNILWAAKELARLLGSPDEPEKP